MPQILLLGLYWHNVHPKIGWQALSDDPRSGVLQFELHGLHNDSKTDAPTVGLVLERYGISWLDQVD